MPEALKVSDNPVLAALGERMYLDPQIIFPDPYGILIDKVYEGTHALLVVGDYLRYTQSKKKITHTSYLLDERVSCTKII